MMSSRVTPDTALVMFSGGQDSTVCLGWALERFACVETVGFDYGQRHAIELTVRPKIREKIATLKGEWKARLGEDHVIEIGALRDISDSALTRDSEIAMAANGLPTTFVPGRNLVFLTFAGALAYRRGAHHLVGGMCEADYSGYPDCRNDAITAMEKALSLGMDYALTIETPLMFIDKAATLALAREIGRREFLDVVIEDTHSCYRGERGRRHVWGHGCGECPACLLRAQGHAKFMAVVEDVR